MGKRAAGTTTGRPSPKGWRLKSAEGARALASVQGEVAAVVLPGVSADAPLAPRDDAGCSRGCGSVGAARDTYGDPMEYSDHNSSFYEYIP